MYVLLFDSKIKKGDKNMSKLINQKPLPNIPFEEKPKGYLYPFLLSPLKTPINPP